MDFYQQENRHESRPSGSRGSKAPYHVQVERRHAAVREIGYWSWQEFRREWLPVSEVAKRAGVHRNFVLDLIHGRREWPVSPYAGHMAQKVLGRWYCKLAMIGEAEHYKRMGVADRISKLEDRLAARNGYTISLPEGYVRLGRWARSRGIHWLTARRWCEAGKIPAARQDEEGRWAVPDKDGWFVRTCPTCKTVFIGDEKQHGRKRELKPWEARLGREGPN